MVKLFIFTVVVGVVGALDLSPKSCRTEHDTHIACLMEKMNERNVVIDMNAARECFKECRVDPTVGGGHKRRPSAHAREERGAGHRGGNRGEGLNTLKSCMWTQIEAPVKRCVGEQVQFETIDWEMPRDEDHHAGGDKRRGGRNGKRQRVQKNKIDIIFEKAQKCGIEDCLRRALGDFYTRRTDLKHAACAAHRACPKGGVGSTCAAEKRQLSNAKCQCVEGLTTEFNTAKNACKTDTNANFIRKITKNKRKMCDREERHVAGGAAEVSPYCIGL